MTHAQSHLLGLSLAEIDTPAIVDLDRLDANIAGWPSSPRSTALHCDRTPSRINPRRSPRAECAARSDWLDSAKLDEAEAFLDTGFYASSSPTKSSAPANGHGW